MSRPGPKRGAPQRQWLSPDAEDEDERVAVYAHVASKARAKGRRAAAAANLSFAAYIEGLLLRDETDADGCPLWAGAATPAEREQTASQQHECERDVSMAASPRSGREVVAS